MTQLVRICKYGCNIHLGEFDTKHNKYLEIDGTLHTKERCESLKQDAKGHDTIKKFHFVIDGVVKASDEKEVRDDLHKAMDESNFPHFEKCEILVGEVD
ncbi:MAG TPA: hypothetical protein VE548_00015 [Nitrososphaeraceae archaeon]|jgi:hypothetical protein|nr:hypothetical protein [Nitrososphaeraceae archaeon]